jgi:hypothetical protein
MTTTLFLIRKTKASHSYSGDFKWTFSQPPRIYRSNVVTKSGFIVLPDSKYSLYVSHSVPYTMRNPNICVQTGRPQRPSNRTWPLIKALTYVGLFVRVSKLCVGVGLHVHTMIWIDSLIVNSVFQSLRGRCRQTNISKISKYNEHDESLHGVQQDNCVSITVDLHQLCIIQQCCSSSKIGHKEFGPQLRKLLTNLTL